MPAKNLGKKYHGCCGSFLPSVCSQAFQVRVPCFNLSLVFRCERGTVFFSFSPTLSFHRSILCFSAAEPKIDPDLPCYFFLFVSTTPPQAIGSLSLTLPPRTPTCKPSGSQRACVRTSITHLSPGSSGKPILSATTLFTFRRSTLSYSRLLRASKPSVSSHLWSPCPIHDYRYIDQFVHPPRSTHINSYSLYLV